MLRLRLQHILVPLALREMCIINLTPCIIMPVSITISNPTYLTIARMRIVNYIRIQDPLLLWDHHHQNTPEHHHTQLMERCQVHTTLCIELTNPITLGNTKPNQLTLDGLPLLRDPPQKLGVNLQKLWHPQLLLIISELKHPMTTTTLMTLPLQQLSLRLLITNLPLLLIHLIFQISYDPIIKFLCLHPHLVLTLSQVVMFNHLEISVC